MDLASREPRSGPAAAPGSAPGGPTRERAARGTRPRGPWSARQASKRGTEPARRAPRNAHVRHANVPRQRAERRAQARDRLVGIDLAPAHAGRPLARREPALEVDVARLEHAPLAMGLEIDAAQELAVVEERQAVVT